MYIKMCSLFHSNTNVLSIGILTILYSLRSAKVLSSENLTDLFILSNLSVNQRHVSKYLKKEAQHIRNKNKEIKHLKITQKQIYLSKKITFFQYTWRVLLLFSLKLTDYRQSSLMLGWTILSMLCMFYLRSETQ